MTKEQIDAAVNGWFNDKIATGAIARNTEAYNQVFLARDDLKARLAAVAAPSPVQPKQPAPAKPDADA